MASLVLLPEQSLVYTECGDAPQLPPQLASPGVNFLSTYPTAPGSYRVMTGTRMATPLVAGVYALLGEAFGKMDPERFRRILAHIFKLLAWYEGKTAHPDILTPVPQQGAGIIQAWDAARATLEIDVDSLTLNDTEHYISTHSFGILNTGFDNEVLDLGERKAVTMYTMDPQADVLQVRAFPNAIASSWATVSFSSDRINVPPG